MKNNSFKKINNTSVVQNVINQLTDAMIDGHFKPGDKIPSEMEMVETFGVGRNTIREAVKILVAYGVLEIQRPEGTFISKGLTYSMINPLLYGIILNQSESYKSVKEFRKVIEVGILKLCIENRTEEDLILLTEKYNTLINEIKKEEPVLKNVFEADEDFHDAIAASTHNMLMESTNQLMRQLTYSRRFETVNHLLFKDQKYYIESHTAFYNCIKNKDTSVIENIVPDKYYIDC